MDPDTSSIVIEYLENNKILPFVEEYPVKDHILLKELRKRLGKMGELHPEEIRDSAVRTRFMRMVHGYPRTIALILNSNIIGSYLIDKDSDMKEFSLELQENLSRNYDDNERFTISDEDCLKLADYLTN